MDLDILRICLYYVHIIVIVSKYFNNFIINWLGEIKVIKLQN